MMKKTIKTTVLAAVSLSLLTVLSCEIGMGSAVDTAIPTVEIQYPPKNAIIRDTFTVSGQCADDLAVDSVSISIQNVSTKESFGPYQATLNEEKTTWTVSLNQKTGEEYSLYDSYKQWEYQDGSYIINAVCKDKAGNSSQQSSIPVAIDNTAPILIVSKPLSLGTETAQKYGRTLNLAGDIAEAHSTTKLTLYYKRYNSTTSSFIDSSIRTLSVSGFNAMSSDSPLVIARYYSVADIAAAAAEEKAKLTEYRNNYLSIYGSDADGTETDDRLYYCGFLLEDNALVYQDPSDEGSGEGNKTTVYYINSDDFSRKLADENAFNLNAQKIMEIVNGTTKNYNANEISSITQILSDGKNSASSTDISMSKSSKFNLNPANNPYWILSGFEFNGSENSFEQTVQNGGKLPIIINTGSDGILIKGNTVGVKIYHLGTDASSPKIDDAEHCLQLISVGSLSGEVSSLNPDCTIENTPALNGFYKPNHFYEIVVEGEDKNGTRILSNGNRYGFMLYSPAKAPDITCETPADDAIFGKAIDTDGITITGKIVTSDSVEHLNSETPLYVESIEVTDASASNPQPLSISYSVPSNQIVTTPHPTQQNTFNFSLKIIKGAAGSLIPSGVYGKYKYAVNLCAKDELDGIGKTTLTIYVDNKAPELNIDSIIPLVKKANDNSNYVNGQVTLSGTVFDSESELASVNYKITQLNSSGEPTGTPVKQAAVTPDSNGVWTVTFNSTSTDFNNLKSYEFEITAVDTKGNSTAVAPVKKTFTIDQETDCPGYHVSNSGFSSDIKAVTGISKTQNMFKKGDKITTQISDDDGIASIKAAYRAAGSTNTFVTIKQITSGISINPYPFDFEVPASEGEWEIELTVTDTEGLPTGTKTDKFVIAVDEGAPVLSEVAIENEKSWYSTNVDTTFTVKGKVEEGSSSYTIKAGERTVTPQTNWTEVVTVPTENGAHSIIYKATDKYGYFSTKKIDFKVDNTKPELSYIKVNTNVVTVNEADSKVWSNRKTLDITVKATDAGGSAINAVSFSKDNSTWTSMKYNESTDSWTSSADYTDSASIDNDKLYIKATDNAGNTSTVKTIKLTIDSTQPELSVICYKTQNTAAAYNSKTVYVNKPITIYGKYSDALSGVTALKFYSGSSTTPLTVTPTYYSSEINSSADIGSLTAVTFAEGSTAVKSWSVTITAPAEGIFKVCGEDRAGNECFDSSFTFVKDTTNPDLTITSLTNSGKPYQSGTTYYIRNKTDGAVTISGTSIDAAIDHTELTVTGLAPVTKTEAAWSVTISDMVNWADSITDADVVIKAYDKAGNVNEKTLHLVFDEKPPVIVHGAYKADYKFRGQDVYKYSLIRFGDANAEWNSLGKYCEYTYGQDTGVTLNLFVRQGSIENTLSNADTEEISGVAKVEYYLLPAGTDLTGLTYNNVLQIAEKANILTGDDSDEAVLTGALAEYSSHNLLRTGEFDKPVRAQYTVYDNGAEVTRYGLKTSATISGLSMTTGTTTNLLFLVPVDNCGNKGSPVVLSIHADNTEPEVTSSSASSILSNGTTNFAFSGTTADVEAGIKAIRFKIGNTLLDSSKADISITGYKDSSKAAACTFGDAAAYAEWTVTVKPDASWFTYQKTDSPVVTVEAEDWAEVNGTGNVNTYTVATLKIDKDAPTVLPQYPVAGSKLNGIKAVTGTVVEENTPKSVKLYIKKKSDITFPSTLTSWGTPVSTISTAAGAATREIYNYSFDDIDFYSTSLIGAAQEKQDIYVLIIAEDEAGNTSVKTNEIKLTDVVSCSIDRNEDRPVVTVTNVKSGEVFGKKNISLNIKDDDGVKKVEYSLNNSSYTDITPASGSSVNIELEDGVKTLYFKVTDTSSAAGKIFTPGAANSWDRVRIVDAAGNEVTTKDTSNNLVFKTTIDLNSPDMELKGITKNGTGTEKTDHFQEMILGGETTSIKLRIEASDTSGIKKVHAEVYINDELKTDINAAASTVSTDPAGTYYAEIPCNVTNYDGTLKLRVIAEDNAKREMKKDYYFSIDNTKPEIRVSMPTKEAEHSGSIIQTGTINEYVKLYYAVSPFETSPDLLTTTTSWSYKYYSPDNPTEQTGTPVTPKSIKEICKYVPAVAAGTDENEKQMSFQIMFDGDTSNTVGVHSATLNNWLVDMGITTQAALTAENPFDNIVYLWLHTKAVDDAGNKKEDHHLIYLDPQGNRPKVTMTYPAEEGATLGGTVTFMGTAMGVNPIATVTLKIDGTEYTVTKEGAGWTCPVDTTLLNDTEEPKEVTITVKATDTATPPNTSRTLTRKVMIDKDTPAISQNLRLVQWKTGYSAANGIQSIAADGTITFKTGATEKNIAYEDGEDVSGAWNLIGCASDNSKVDKIKYKKDGGAQIEVTVSDTAYSSGGVYIKRCTTGTKTTSALFSFPVGNKDANKVGSTQYDIEVLDDSDPKQTDRKFTVYYDNKAPVLITDSDSRYNIDSSVYNSNGYYNFSSVATEAAVDGVNQTGIERIAFYFTKELTVSGTTTYSIFDTAIASGSAGNQISSTTSPDATTGYNGLVYSDGLWWRKYASGVTVSNTTVTIGTADSNIHKGSLAKVNGAIYSVTAVSGTTITLDSVAASASEVYFAIASVVDGKALNETVGKQAIINQGSTYIWNASINSKNMSDGTAELHYVVFDGAGNYSSEDVDCLVQNKAPRIVGMTLGTDENGNGEVEESEFNKTSYTNLFTKGYRTNSDNTVTRTVNVTFPTSSTDAAPLSALKVKGKTVIKPEIVGGTGSISYTYSIAKRNAAGTGWATPYFEYETPETLGTGTGENENTTVTLTNNIQLNVTDIVKDTNGIQSGNNQKFSFKIADSTPGTSLVATMNVIMDVYLVDKTAATNYIIPFYWKNINDNSLYNSKNAGNWLDLNGHIELPKDLNEAKDKDGNNNFTATGTGIHSLNPKVSGQIKIEGIARDEVLLNELSVAVKLNESITKTYTLAQYNKTAATGYTPANSGFLKPAAKTMADDGWEVSIQQATFGEYMAAGYISELPKDEDGEDYSPNSKVPYFSQEYGHVVHWVLNLDTQRLDNTIKAKTGVLITVSAKDQGEPASNGSYTSNNFKNNSATGTATPIANVLQTGGTLGEAAHTCKYTVDIVPYIGGVKSKLSERKTASGEKDNTTEYDRTALGHYPLASTEKAYFYGFNLKEGATVTDKAGNTLSLGAANTSKYTEYTVYPTSASLASFTSGKVSVTVDGVESLNNRNYNEAKGAYVPDENNDPDVIYNNCYNRTPNTDNNYILTDDVILDVWKFDSTAAKPYASGVVSDPIMKINPNNGIIGFAYQSGTKAFSMADGNSSSYRGWIGDYDNLSSTGFAYDSAGNTYGTALGGDINNAYSVSKFCFVSSLWQGQNTENSGALSKARAARIEEIGQIGKKGQTNAKWSTVADRLIDKARVLSPAIAVAGSGNDATVYIAYYDHLNREIRFRWGAQPKTGSAEWTGTSYIRNYYTEGALSGESQDHIYNKKGVGNVYQVDEEGKAVLVNNKKVVSYVGNRFQIIAENATESGSEVPADTKTLGKPGSYVDIAVLPAGSTGNSTGYDIVMIVWYDSKNDNLLYTYNQVKLSDVSAEDFSGSEKTKVHWKTAKSIMKKAGQYCKIAVDKNGGVHIAGYDSVVGDVRYAYLESYDANYNEATDSCYVDTNGIVGSDLTLDVALNKSAANGGKPVPYIGYYGANGPKLAYLNVAGIPEDVDTVKGMSSTDTDMFTGCWEVTEIPTPSNTPRDRVNVGVWKDASTGVIKASNSSKTAKKPTGSYTTASDSVTIGNGTMNPVVAYQVRPSAAEGYIETAQMQ